MISPHPSAITQLFFCPVCCKTEAEWMLLVKHIRSVHEFPLDMSIKMATQIGIDGDGLAGVSVVHQSKGTPGT